MAKPKKPAKWDFEGWATRYGVKCADGETIAHGAFKNMDGEEVSLVDDHARGYESYLDAVIGKAYLEHRDEGVYAYINFNKKYDKAKLRHEQVLHGDIQRLSIKANMLKRDAGRIVGGVIRDLSIVASGANPGAFIQQAQLVHGDGYTEDIEDEAYICFNDTVSDTIEHDSEGADGENRFDKAIRVYRDMTPEQREATDLIAAGLAATAMSDEDDDEDDDDEDDDDDSDEDDDDDSDEDDDDDSDEDDDDDFDEDDDDDSDDSGIDQEINHSESGGKRYMKANEFDTGREGTEENTIVHAADFFDTLGRTLSMKEACIEHGITNVTDLYDDPTLVNPEPLILNTPQGWVKSVLGGVKKVPFTKIKSLWTDLSAFTGDHRALGYPVLGEQKKDEEIEMLNRITEPTWIYKRQTMDRDTLYQITSFNFLQWIQSEMGMMLNQELARAILISDGRLANDAYKIKEDRIRPIAFDTSVWTIQDLLAVSAGADDILDELIAARSDYQGSGDPTLYVSGTQLGAWLTLKNSLGNRIYKNASELASLVRCKEIVEVPQMSVAVTAAGNPIKAIMVNMADYALSLPTGNSALKDTRFDIDKNKETYLLEWLVGGALIVPKSAVVVSQTAAT